MFRPINCSLSALKLNRTHKTEPKLNRTHGFFFQNRNLTEVQKSIPSCVYETGVFYCELCYIVIV